MSTKSDSLKKIAQSFQEIATAMTDIAETLHEVVPNLTPASVEDKPAPKKKATKKKADPKPEVQEEKEPEATEEDSMASLLGTEPEAPKEAKVYTKDDITAKLQTVNKEMGLEAAKNLIVSFNIPNLQGLQESQYADFAEKADELIKEHEKSVKKK
jgi:hypothetical protein